MNLMTNTNTFSGVDVLFIFLEHTAEKQTKNSSGALGLHVKLLELFHTPTRQEGTGYKKNR